MSQHSQEAFTLSKKLKILYVENDLDAKEIMKRLFESFFIEVTVAVDSQDAIEKFTTERFDLLVSAVNLSPVNYLEMLKKIRAKDSEFPIILLFSSDESSKVFEAMPLNIDAFFLKPVVREEFEKVLHKIVAKTEMQTLSHYYKQEFEAEVQKRNEEIIYKLNFDSLTNLGSRYSFFKTIEQTNTPVILLVDIDKFKTINEVYGTNVGSKVLQKFASCLGKLLQEESYKAFRLSADEFAIVDTSIYIDTDRYEELLEKLFEKLNGVKFEIDTYKITVDITVGLSTVSENSYESAKIALDFAKKNKKPFIMYSSAIDHRKESSLTLKCRDDIVSAIDEKRVVAVYQPIVDANENIVKYETLMRLQEQDSLNLMSPFYFLDVAIKTRLYEHLSSNIIFQALNMVRDKGVCLSVNFMYSDIKNREFIRKVEQFLIHNSEVGPKLIIEITESESIENYDDMKIFINTFRKYGVKIAIDDFGSGFSNFEYILEIEPDYIKIDGSLVKDIDSDKKAYTLVEAIIQFSHQLGIKTIAEYVHSETIFAMLKELNVDEYQGFYFYEPLEKII